MPRNLTCIRASLYRVFSLIWPLKTIFVQLSTNISPYILCYDHFCTHLVQVTFTETKANKITTWGMFTENIFTLLQTKGTFRKYNYWRSKRYSSKGVLEEKKKRHYVKGSICSSSSCSDLFNFSHHTTYTQRLTVILASIVNSTQLHLNTQKRIFYMTKFSEVIHRVI